MLPANRLGSERYQRSGRRPLRHASFRFAPLRVSQRHYLSGAAWERYRKLRRKNVLAFFAKLAPCLVGMEACGSAHYWAREIAKLGHSVKLMPPKYVKAYVKRGKTDAGDAAAICEAVTRPSMSFVPVKGVEQQGLSMLHSARSQLIGQRTALISCVRWPTSCERALCSIDRPCCSSPFTGTKVMLGRVTASQIAAASPASVLPRLT